MGFTVKRGSEKGSQKGFLLDADQDYIYRKICGGIHFQYYIFFK